MRVNTIKKAVLLLNSSECMEPICFVCVILRSSQYLQLYILRSSQYLQLYILRSSQYLQLYILRSSQYLQLHIAEMVRCMASYEL